MLKDNISEDHNKISSRQSYFEHMFNDYWGIQYTKSIWDATKVFSSMFDRICIPYVEITRLKPDSYKLIKHALKSIFGTKKFFNTGKEVTLVQFINGYIYHDMSNDNGLIKKSQKYIPVLDVDRFYFVTPADLGYEIIIPLITEKNCVIYSDDGVNNDAINHILNIEGVNFKIVGYYDISEAVKILLRGIECICEK